MSEKTVHPTTAGAEIRTIISREGQIDNGQSRDFDLACEKKTVAGSVSQRACTFCGSRVILYPISDALHLIHGPVGCAAYTWDIRGALSSGVSLHRMSFNTDLREPDVVMGGEKKLGAALDALIAQYKPKAAFVYATCIVGVIGDDVMAVCKKASQRHNIPVIPVHSEGFRGTKKDGYKAACDAIATLIGMGEPSGISPHSINLLGEFNIAGETWIIKDYYERMGVEVVSSVTGDGRVNDIQRCHGAALNVVQCSGSMTHLAEEMKEKYGIPYLRVSYFGIEDTAKALYDVAEHFDSKELRHRAALVVSEEIEKIRPFLQNCKEQLAGKTAAVYVGGAFKAFSLIRSLRSLGMQTLIAGSQTGNKEDYKTLKQIADPGAVIIDDANTLELAKFLLEKEVDLFIGGVKERPIAYKLGVGFCDHNHERKTALAGFEGMANFAKEVLASVTSPVWQLTARRSSK